VGGRWGPCRERRAPRAPPHRHSHTPARCATSQRLRGIQHIGQHRLGGPSISVSVSANHITGSLPLRCLSPLRQQLNAPLVRVRLAMNQAAHGCPVTALLPFAAGFVSAAQDGSVLLWKVRLTRHWGGAGALFSCVGRISTALPLTVIRRFSRAPCAMGWARCTSDPSPPRRPIRCSSSFRLPQLHSRRHSPRRLSLAQPPLLPPSPPQPQPPPLLSPPPLLLLLPSPPPLLPLQLPPLPPRLHFPPLPQAYHPLPRCPPHPPHPSSSNLFPQLPWPLL